MKKKPCETTGAGVQLNNVLINRWKFDRIALVNKDDRDRWKFDRIALVNKDDREKHTQNPRELRVSWICINKAFIIIDCRFYFSINIR